MPKFTWGRRSVQVYECQKCGTLHTGTGYQGVARELCGLHACEQRERMNAEEKREAERRYFHTRCDKYAIQVKALLDNLDKTNVAAGNWGDACNKQNNSSQGVTNNHYQRSTFDSQPHD